MAPENHSDVPLPPGRAEQAGPLVDDALAQILGSINDPEVGVSIVDLGLVYRAERTADGAKVLMTMTTPSCPMAEMLASEVRIALSRHFSGVVTVDICWDPPWSPARISDAGRRQLGWSDKPEREARRMFSLFAKVFRSRTRH